MTIALFTAYILSQLPLGILLGKYMKAGKVRA
jgi:hypothetical protein